MDDAVAIATASRPFTSIAAVLRALRPAQWLKNGLVLAGLVFGAKLFDLAAAQRAILAAGCFCLLSSGFYLLNDVRDAEADRLHPNKRTRPVAAGELTPAAAGVLGLVLIVLATLAGTFLGTAFVAVVFAYSALMLAYNLALKEIVLIDVIAIAVGFVLRAVGGAFAVDVSISPWLLVCTVLLALLLGFGKRRYELAALQDAQGHRRSLALYSQSLLDRAVAATAVGTLVAYAAYAFEGGTVPTDVGMALTIPLVAVGIVRYVFLVYRRGEGGSPETMLLTDRVLLATVAVWSVVSSGVLYFAR